MPSLSNHVLRRAAAAAAGRRLTAGLVTRLAAPAVWWRLARSMAPGLVPARAGLTVSFDCDLPEDADVLPALADALGGTRASFAVVGEHVRAAPVAYQRLLAGGHEVLNHGHTSHTRREGDAQLVSTYGFHQLSQERWHGEVVAGHEAIVAALDVHPIGFRTPHFGSFQQPAQLRCLHALLAKLGYRYSSSSTWSAPSVSSPSVVELPMATCPDHPLFSFDSWHAVSAPGAAHRTGDFVTTLERMVEGMLAVGGGRLLTFFADPHAVAGSAPFLEWLAGLGNRPGLWVGSYRDLLGQG